MTAEFNLNKGELIGDICYINSDIYIALNVIIGKTNKPHYRTFLTNFNGKYLVDHGYLNEIADYATSINHTNKYKIQKLLYLNEKIIFVQDALPTPFGFDKFAIVYKFENKKLIFEKTIDFHLDTLIWKSCLPSYFNKSILAIEKKTDTNLIRTNFPLLLDDNNYIGIVRLDESILVFRNKIGNKNLQQENYFLFEKIPINSYGYHADFENGLFVFYSKSEIYLYLNIFDKNKIYENPTVKLGYSKIKNIKFYKNLKKMLICCSAKIALVNTDYFDNCKEFTTYKPYQASLNEKGNQICFASELNTRLNLINI